MTTDINKTSRNTKQERKGPVIEGALGRPVGGYTAPSTLGTDPLTGIIANAAENQRKRNEEKKRREAAAKEARARFALD